MKTKTIVCQGFTREEALKNVEAAVRIDGTQAWRKAGAPAFGTPEFEVFKENYIASHKKEMKESGDAFSVTTVGGAKDSKTRPYKIENVKTEGRTKFETVIGIVNPETEEVLDTTATTKAEAMAIAKSIISKEKINVVCRQWKEVRDGDGVLFTGTYVPSKSAKTGTYVVVIAE